MKSFNSILSKVLETIKPTEEELKKIENCIKEFITSLGKNIAEKKVEAEIFIGGSFAKNTVIKKEKYDVDVFLRFDKKYDTHEISSITESLLKSFKGVSTIHGSRDYFRIKIDENFLIELIPVIKAPNPSEAENITDLSFSHVKYINQNIKSKNTLDEIMLAKAFCYANNCYGAESYINGFSGYSLELLIHHYGSFMKFLRAMLKVGKEKLIIDMENYYKPKKNVLIDINSSKLSSPIILVDPTYKQRNALAALSRDTLQKFQEITKDFINNPRTEAFERRKTDLEEIKACAEKDKFEFILIGTETQKQEGDVAGTKLFKFYKHLSKEISKFFLIKNNGFNYNERNAARYFFVVKNKEDILVTGPDLKDSGNAEAFKKKHPTYFTKKGKLYSKEKFEGLIEDFIKEWKHKNKLKIKEMYITNLEIIK